MIQARIDSLKNEMEMRRGRIGIEANASPSTVPLGDRRLLLTALACMVGLLATAVWWWISRHEPGPGSMGSTVANPDRSSGKQPRSASELGGSAMRRMFPA